MRSLLLQLDSKSESELKEEDEEDYAMNSESYLEVRPMNLPSVHSRRTKLKKSTTVVVVKMSLRTA